MVMGAVCKLHFGSRALSQMTRKLGEYGAAHTSTISELGEGHSTSAWRTHLHFGRHCSPCRPKY
jgi:hypothetical protein